MAEVRVLKSLTITHGSIEVTYFHRGEEADLLEIRIKELLIRMTIGEFHHIVQEVARATNR